MFVDRDRNKGETNLTKSKRFLVEGTLKSSIEELRKNDTKIILDRSRRDAFVVDRQILVTIRYSMPRIGRFPISIRIIEAVD